MGLNQLQNFIIAYIMGQAVFKAHERYKLRSLKPWEIPYVTYSANEHVRETKKLDQKLSDMKSSDFESRATELS